MAESAVFVFAVSSG